MRPRLIEKDELLDPLLEAFADLGFDGTSIREICRHLGVSHNMVHKRYHSKEGAWTAAVDHAFTRLNATLFAPFDVLLSEEDRLRAVMRRWVDLTIEQPALARVIHQEAARPGPRFDYMMASFIGPVQDIVRQTITEQQAAGWAKDGPIAAAFFFLVTWGIGGIASSQRLAELAGMPGDDPRQAAYAAVDIVVAGVRSPTVPSPAPTTERSRPSAGPVD